MTPLEKLGYTSADVERWVSECDPEIKPDWDQVECFRARVKEALRPRFGMALPVVISRESHLPRLFRSPGAVPSFRLTGKGGPDSLKWLARRLPTPRRIDGFARRVGDKSQSNRSSVPHP